MADERIGVAGVTGAGGLRGTIRIAPAVLIELIELTVSDIPGVVGFQPRRVERFLPRKVHHPDAAGRGAAYEADGVRVRIAGDRIDADVVVVVDPDANIREIGRAVRRNVGAAVGRMLGMHVSEVNLYVAGIASGSDAED